jgi:hypothetical protein
MPPSISMPSATSVPTAPPTTIYEPTVITIRPYEQQPPPKPKNYDCCIIM